MLLPNKGINLIFKHSSSIINIFHLDFNSSNHFISLSDNSEIIEFLLIPGEDKINEIEKFHIKRPDNDLLERNGFKIKLEKTIEDIYNPKKKDVNIINKENKEIKKKEIPKSEKINKNMIKNMEKEIEDDWVICTGENNNNINNNKINLFDDFVIGDSNQFNETFDYNKKGKKAKKKKK